MAEPIQKQRVSFPLFLGRDGGSDPKAVRNNLLEAKNVWHKPEGALSKRPGVLRAQDVLTTSSLVGADSFFAYLSGTLAKVNSTAAGQVTYSRTGGLQDHMIDAKRVTLPVNMGSVKSVSWGPSTTFLADMSIDIIGDSSVSPGTDEALAYYYNTSTNITTRKEASPATSPSVFTTAGRWYIDGLSVKNPYGDTLTAGALGSVIGWDVLEFTEGGTRFEVAAALSSLFVLHLWLYEDGVQVDYSGNSVGLPNREGVLGLYHEPANSQFAVVTQESGAVPSHLYERRYTYAASTITALGSHASITATSFAGTTVGKVTSFARTNVVGGSFGPYAGFIVTCEGGATEVNDHVYMHRPSPVGANYVLHSVPSGTYLMCHGIDVGDKEPYTHAIMMFASSSTKVTTGGTPVYDGFPTEINTPAMVRFMGTSYDLEVLYSIYPREGQPRDTTDWAPLSHPLDIGGALFVPMAVGGGVTSLAVTKITLPKDVIGRIPTIRYDRDYLSANPCLIKASEGLLLHHPVATTGLELAEQASGSLTATSTYKYLLLPVFTAGDGRLIYGRPSDPVTITLTGSNTGVVVTRRDEAGDLYAASNLFQMQIYRTEAGGSTYYFVGAMDTSYTDTTADANLGAALYNTADAVAHFSPPPIRDLWSHEGRIWIIPADDSSVLWYSRKRPDSTRLTVPAGEGPSFTISATIDIGAGAEPVRGVSFGGACVIFTTEEVYILGGEGPNSAGVGDFSPPQMLAVPPIKDPNSLVSTGEALIYKSSESWIKLDRGFNYKAIGNPVGDYDSQTVLSAIDRNDGNVQFLLSDGTTSLVFDIELEQWFVWEYVMPLTRIVAKDGAQGCVGQEPIRLVGNDAYSFLVTEELDSPTGHQFVDANTSEYTMLVETRWFNVDSFAGFQRLYEIGVLGQWKSSHTLKITIYYDYDETDFEAVTEVVSADPGTYLFRWQPKKQVSRAFKLRIEEVSPSGTEESFTLTGLDAIIGVKPRTHFGPSESIT